MASERVTSDDAERALRHAGDTLRAERTRDAAYDDAAHTRARRKLIDAATRPSARRRNVAMGVAAGVVAVAAALGVIAWTQRAEPLALVVDGSAVEAGAFVAARADREAQLRFSDGTALSLAPGARARVDAVDADGARLLLESGTLRARVVHRRGARWTIDAGPFEVRVTGTAFEVRWDSRAQAFELTLSEGSVLVDGPVVGAARAVVAGQTLRVAGGRMEVVERHASARRDSTAEHMPTTQNATQSAATSTGTPTDAAPTTTDTPTTNGDVPLAAGARRAPRQEDDAPSWQQLATERRYTESLARAETRGLDTLCATAPVAELRRLADVARYAGAPDRAISVLGCVRSRFPRSAAAAESAFMLGRLGAPDAPRWFQTYLDEAPDGPFSDEAWGRLIESHASAGRDAEARQLATRYLAERPHGPYAERAQRVVRSSPR